MKSLLCVSASVALVLMLAARAEARGPEPIKIGAGVSFVKFNDDLLTEKGFRVDVSQIMKSMTNGGLAWVGELGWTKQPGSTTLVVGGGVRYVVIIKDSKISPYGHALFGLAHYTFPDEDGESGPYFAFGGGGTLKLNDKISAFLQFDFLIIKITGSDKVERYTGGIVIDLNRK